MFTSMERRSVTFGKINAKLIGHVYTDDCFIGVTILQGNSRMHVIHVNK